MLGKVFKAYDIRAPYPKPLNEKLAWQIGYGTAQFLIEEASNAGYDDPMMRHIVVGHDMRQSSPSLSTHLKQGIRDFGAHVIDIGLVDTPMIYFAVNHLACCGGVQTTASHNPSNYNGFKISKIHAKPVGELSGLDEIRRHAAMADREKVTPAGGREEQRDLWDAYREHVLRFLDPDLITGRRKLKVVIDASNGMAGTMIPMLFDGVKGLTVTKINFDNSTGEFVHEPNPLVAANLRQTRDAVREQKADIGFCFDGDADRCMVVDEQAEIVPCDHLTAWLATEILAQHPGESIVYDLRSTKALPELIEKHGGKPIRSRVGHVFMKQVMAENNAIFGGELSGHFYYRDNFFADSGAIAFASVVSALARNRKRLSSLIEPARKYVQSGEVNFEVEDKDDAIAELQETYAAEGAKTDDLDGITIDMGSWWFNVRPSNTEPLLRLNVEGPDVETVRAKVEEIKSLLGEAVAH
jgi:phosphomannomutase